MKSKYTAGDGKPVISSFSVSVALVVSCKLQFVKHLPVRLSSEVTQELTGAILPGVLPAQSAHSSRSLC